MLQCIGGDEGGTVQKALMAAIIVIRHCVEVFCVSLVQEYLSFGVLPKNRNIGNSYTLYVYLYLYAVGTGTGLGYNMVCVAVQNIFSTPTTVQHTPISK